MHQKLIPFFALLLMSFILSGCVQKVPEEYKDHPCARHCYFDKTTGIDESFAAQFENSKQFLSGVKKPVCREYSEQWISDFESKGFTKESLGTTLGPFSPACDGPYTLCDCELKDGTFVSDHLIVEEGRFMSSFMSKVIKQG